MSRFKNESSLAEKPSSATAIQANGPSTLPRIDESVRNSADRGPLLSNSSQSFLMILLRALAAWHV